MTLPPGHGQPLSPLARAILQALEAAALDVYQLAADLTVRPVELEPVLDELADRGLVQGHTADDRGARSLTASGRWALRGSD